MPAQAIALPKSNRLTISIDTCPKHPKFFAVSVNRGSGGTRLTPSKCCGSWTEVASWAMTPDNLREIAKTLLDTADAARGDV